MITTTNPAPTPHAAEARRRYAEASAALHHPLARACLHIRPGHAIRRALASIPSLCDEAERLSALLAIARRAYQDLTAAARATFAADADGERDPLYYLRDELHARDQLPHTHREGPR